MRMFPHLTVLILMLCCPVTLLAQTVDKAKTSPVVKKTLTLKTTQPARISPEAETPIYSKLSGYIKQVHVDIGEIVKQDQLLISLNLPELMDDVNQKKSSLLQATAVVKQTEAQIVATKALIEASKAKVKQAEANSLKIESEYNRWKSEADRMRELAIRGAITQQIADEAQQKLEATIATREEVKALIATAKAELGVSEAQLITSHADRDAALAKVEVVQSQIKQAQTMLDYAEIKAPYAGVVTSRVVDAGHFVTESTKPLLVIMNTEKIRVKIDIPELEAPWVNLAGPYGRPADKVSMYIKSLNQTIQGEITRMAWAIDESNRSMRVEVDLPNKDNLLRPGMYATAIINLEERPDVLTVPAAAIVREADKTYCHQVKNGIVVRKQVTLGLRVDPDIQITSGVEENEKVITIRPESFKPDQKVEELP